MAQISNERNRPFDRYAFEKRIFASDLPAPARHVAHVLAAHADRRSGECWPSWATLATETGLSRATVARSLDTLAGAGLLARAPRGRGTIYRLRSGPQTCPAGLVSQ